MESYDNNNVVSYDSQNGTGEVKLTVREQQCLWYLLEGLTAKKIARLINISHRTVETHLAHIRKKYGCSNKLELIAKVLKAQIDK